MTHHEKMEILQRDGVIPTDCELSQAYEQGYQDGRKGLAELAEALREIERMTADGYERNRRGILAIAAIARGALAKLAQEQEPKT